MSLDGMGLKNLAMRFLLPHLSLDGATKRVRVVRGLAMVILLCLAASLSLSAQNMTTYAGNGVAGYTGDGGPATNAELDLPDYLAVGAGVDIYIADMNNLVIRKVSGATGIITTYAGGGTGCTEQTDQFGDGCPATSAILSDPNGMQVDAAGNLFFADSADLLVRRVDAATGIITLVAGNGTGCPQETDSAGDGCPATQALFLDPHAVGLDPAGNLYISDSNLCLIREVNAGTGIITSIAGTIPSAGPTAMCGYGGDGGPATAALLNGPAETILDSTGNIIIADTFNCLIRKITAASGIITTVAGTTTGAGTGANCAYGGDGGPATSADLNSPFGLTLDPAGSLYISDYDNCIIRKVTAGTGVITTVAGTTTGAGTSANCAYGGDGGPATSAQLNFPSDVNLDSAGNLYIADFQNSRIRKVTFASTTPTSTTLVSNLNPSFVGDLVTFTATVSPSGTPPPSGTVAFTADGNTISGCGAVTLASLMAQCSTAALTVGTHIIVATYSGDSNFSGSSGSLSQVVKEPATTTTTTLASSVNPSILGQSVTFTATVSPSGTPPPTGTVAFTADGTTISGCGAVALLPSLTAQCSTAALSIGTHAIVATYSGDSNFTGSSGVLSQVVNAPAISTTTVVTSSLNPSMAGQSVTFTATVSPSPGPTGTVSYTADGTTLSGCAAVVLASAQAQCTTSSLAVGTHAIVATYSGDSNYTGSSGSLSQVVNAPVTGTTTALTSSLNPSTFGQAVTFTAAVSPSPGPTGTVAFTSDGTTLSGCGGVALASGQAQCSTSTLAVGTHAIVATYSGDTNYSGSSGSLSQVVNSAAPMMGSFTISATPSYQEVQGGGAASYNLIVTSVDGFAGLVTLSCAGEPKDGSCSFSTSPTVTLVANGTAQSAMTVTTTTADAALIVAPVSVPQRRVSLATDDWRLATVFLPFNTSGLAALLAGLLKRRKASKRSQFARVLCLLAVILMMMGIAGCGCPPTGHASYTITVTGTSGAQSASTSVTLVVGQRSLQ